MRNQSLINWFYEKEFNGKVSEEASKVFSLIGISKILDRILEIGSENGLTALLWDAKCPIDVIEFDKKRAENAKRIYQQAGAGVNVQVIEDDFKRAELKQYDLVIFNCPEQLDNYKDIYEHLKKTLLPDAFIILPEQVDLGIHHKDRIALHEWQIIKL